MAFTGFCFARGCRLPRADADRGSGAGVIAAPRAVTAKCRSCNYCAAIIRAIATSVAGPAGRRAGGKAARRPGGYYPYYNSGYWRPTADAALPPRSAAVRIPRCRP